MNSPMCCARAVLRAYERAARFAEPRVRMELLQRVASCAVSPEEKVIACVGMHHSCAHSFAAQSKATPPSYPPHPATRSGRQHITRLPSWRVARGRSPVQTQLANGCPNGAAVTSPAKLAPLFFHLLPLHTYCSAAHIA